MSIETTGRLRLPMIESGQAAKELTHNEALALLDLAVQCSVMSASRSDPPAQPAVGDAWIVGAVPTGAWAGHADDIAGWTPGGWRFVAAREGMSTWVADVALDARYRGGAWSLGNQRVARLLIDGVPVVGARADAIAEPQGGAVVDAEARDVLGRIVHMLQGHGLIA